MRASLRRKWSTIPKAGRSWGCVPALDPCGRTIFAADAHRHDGTRYVVRADEKLTAFLELESAIDRLQQDEVLKPLQCCCSVTVQP
jgi:hypothetical protein